MLMLEEKKEMVKLLVDICIGLECMMVKIIG
jgi:hypothetical protein